MSRPDCIRHYTEILSDDNQHYPESQELLARTANFGQEFGFQKIGGGIDVIPPGRRNCWPHAHSDSEEFFYVIEGEPDVWIDGELHPLKPGDGVGFPSGTGVSHCIINNTNTDVRILVIGEATHADDLWYYPQHEMGNERARSNDRFWADRPRRTLGDHDGLPDDLRDRIGPGGFI